MRLISAGVLLVILSAFHVLALAKAAEQKKSLPRNEGSSYVIPSPILKITALEFDDIASDFMFLQALVFEGSTFERKERPRVKEWEYKWMYNTLNASTDLDPYFFDPYYMGTTVLTWEGNLIMETNAMLDKGIRHREWDTALPFYAGFNSFYFLQDNDKASEYLMEASKRPGASPLYVTLAVRLANKAKKTENAIIFLQEMLKNTEDEALKKSYEKRLDTLKKMLFLERAAALYEERFKTKPEKLEDLLAKNIIREIPPDPYNGKFYIDKDGSIKTTSELR